MWWVRFSIFGCRNLWKYCKVIRWYMKHYWKFIGFIKWKVRQIWKCFNSRPAKDILLRNITNLGKRLLLPRNIFPIFVGKSPNFGYSYSDSTRNILPRFVWKSPTFDYSCSTRNISSRCVRKPLLLVIPTSIEIFY